MSQNPQIQALISKLTADLEAVFQAQALSAAQDALRHALGQIGGGAVGPETVSVKRGPGRPRKAVAALVATAAPAVATARKPARVGKASKKAANGGRYRRSETELAAIEDKIVAYFRAHPGARGEIAKKELGLATRDWALPLRKLVDTGRLRAKGIKRSTTYTVG